MAGPERLILSVAVKGAVEGSPRQQDLHRVGTVLRVAKMLRFPTAPIACWCRAWRARASSSSGRTRSSSAAASR